MTMHAGSKGINGKGTIVTVTHHKEAYSPKWNKSLLRKKGKLEAWHFCPREGKKPQSVLLL